jgi:hypothetical protein
MCKYWVVCNVFMVQYVGWWDTPTILGAKCRQLFLYFGTEYGTFGKYTRSNDV